MRSSTSSSERPIPGGAWGHTWLLAIAFTLVGVVALERATRAHGQQPTVVDDPILWSWQRQRVDNNRLVIAFLGTSRMVAAYDPSALAASGIGRPTVLLAIDGTSGLGVLEDLARDPAFVGTAVVELAEWELTLDAFDEAAPFVNRSHALWRAPGAWLNRALSLPVQEHFALLAVGGRHFFASAAHRKWPPPTWSTMTRDRVTDLDYANAEEDRVAKRRAQAVEQLPLPPLPMAFDAVVHRTAAAVEQIRKRGGHVVFVHLPITGELAAKTQQYYPRSRYWNGLGERVGAPFYHFTDVPELANLACPDGMHIDQLDQPAAMRGIVHILRDAGILKPTQSSANAAAPTTQE